MPWPREPEDQIMEEDEGEAEGQVPSLTLPVRQLLETVQSEARQQSVEEYTREFEQLLLKCDLREDETQTLVRYLASLDEKIAHVVEQHPYSTLDELSSLAYKVELQRKIKGKEEASKPS